MLRQLINNMPTAIVRLCEVKDNGEVNESLPIALPISDHDIIVGSNKHGTFATWNSLNPDSPVSPGFSPVGVTGLRRIYHEDERQEHIKQISKMVISLFKNGVDALALQEVPAITERYFTPFLLELKKLSDEETINLDFEAFQTSYAQTKKPFKKGVEQGYHGFGTALLFKKNAFYLEGCSILPHGRGSLYSLKSAKSNDTLNLININGDYNQAESLVVQIFNYLSIPNTIIAGDTNIAIANEKIVEQLRGMHGVVVEPTTNRIDTPERSRTLDCFVTTILTSYIYKTGSKNYANSEITG